MILSLLLPAFLPQAATVNLFRGSAVVSPHYWDVEDTTLDSLEPDKGFGGNYTLVAGKGKSILIRFGDLNRMVGPRKHVVKASLYLTPTGGDPPVLRTAGRLLQSWGEGPRTVIGNIFVAPPKPGTKPIPPHWIATYHARKAGISNWQTAGALGAEDQAPIKSAHIEQANKEFAVTGMEEAVQFMIDHPNENNGFVLQFDSATEFLSSKANIGRPRLEISTEDAPADLGPDLSVISLTTDPVAPHGGENVTYTATIKNVGAAASQGFAGNWLVNERPGTPFDKSSALAPGATVAVTFQKRFDATPTDHRVNPIGIRIVPVGPDANPNNNSLSITEDAIPVSVNIPSDLVAKMNATNYLGSQSWEDWAQGQVKLWNDTVAAESRFSFAPDGALERIRIGSLTGGDGGVTIPADATPTSASSAFLKSLGLAIGMLDGNAFQMPAAKVQVAGSTTRSCVDLFPGIMGYGDTRFEGGIPAFPIPFEPAFDASLVGTPMEVTDLLSANDVAGLNTHLAGKPAKPSDNLLPISKGIILSVFDMQGQKLANTDMLFFQSSNGSMAGGNPVFAVKTNDGGIAILNARGSAGPFGDLTPNADNGIFLVQAKINGVLETGWLRAWELAEDHARQTVTSTLRLNLPALPVDRSANLATDRILTDSASSLPAVLAPLIDDAEDTEATLPDAAGSWVEIDLGRDRFVGEVDLVTSGKPFWQQFDIAVYGTGQKVQEGTLFARELNWSWSSLVRKDAGKTAATSTIAYRGAPQRIRYIRLINKSGGPGSLAELRIFGAKVNN